MVLLPLDENAKTALQQGVAELRHNAAAFAYKLGSLHRNRGTR